MPPLSAWTRVLTAWRINERAGEARR
jgi:hypothetical protein